MIHQLEAVCPSVQFELALRRRMVAENKGAMDHPLKGRAGKLLPAHGSLSLPAT